MSTPPSSPYQSRLFNFLSRHTRKWVDRGDRTLRHLQVTVTWGVQILLYPAYAAFQAVGLAGKQLQQAAQQRLPRLFADLSTTPPKATAPRADQPIQRVLSSLQTNSDAGVEQFRLPQGATIATLVKLDSGTLEPASEVGLQQKPRSTVQGVASCLTSNALVLVTPANEILDILTPEQQRQLRQRIIWEVASYYYELRLLQTGKRQPQVSRLQPPAVQAPVLPLARSLWQLMGWMQTSPVAVAANLFQEVALVQSQAILEPAAFVFPQPSILQQITPHHFFSLLDHRIAELEATSLPPPVLEISGAIVHQGQTWMQQIRTTYGSDELDRLIPAVPPLPPAWQSQGLRVQALIQAAITYFFGAPTSGQALAEVPTAQFLPSAPPELLKVPSLEYPASPFAYLTQLFSSLSHRPSPQPAEPDEEDLWLNMTDLFGDPDFSEGLLIEAEAELLTNPPRLPGSHPHQALPPQTLSSTRSGVAPLVQSTATSSPQPSQQWIETQATTVGYVKHPLEQILAWLDRGMRWLEDGLIRLWQKWQRHHR